MKVEQCQSVDDIVVHLVANLAWIDEDVAVGVWRQRFGFRRGPWTSQAWHNTVTNEWAFHVSDGAFTGMANMGTYDTFHEMLHGVAGLYEKSWLISSPSMSTTSA